VLIAPDGHPRTKPRALSFALDFCDGDIIGVYDAEDRPAPDQIRKVVSGFQSSGPEVACLQARLGYYNAKDGWLTRCFAIEYAIWFDVLLRGMSLLRLPIPLGGTSVFFRRGPLADLGAWDAHNVTEDADLGMRLARAGYRCGLVDSLTEEEASCRPLGWIRQRSRWLKGFMQTWLTHMRRPRRLLSDLGVMGFLAFQVLFLGAAAAYLAQPLFWGALVFWAVEGRPLWDHLLPTSIAWPCFGAMLAGNLVMLTAAIRAVTKRNQKWLTPWIATLPLYWPLGALAAYKAVFELALAPTYWDKTKHNVSRQARQLNQQAEARRS
jgi:cellulose synthase/poly-beta-1,6-N-acetylglucosamine synthase-like glycosyltransferase